MNAIAEAFVDIRPDTRGFRTALNRQLKAAVEQVRDPAITIQPNLRGFRSTLRRELQTIAADVSPLRIDVVPNVRGFRTRLRAELEALRPYPNIPIQPSIQGDAHEEVLAALRRQLAGLRGRVPPVEVPVEPDSQGIWPRLRASIQAEVDRGARITPIRLPPLGIAAGDLAAGALASLISLVGQLGAGAVALASQLGSAAAGFTTMGAAAARSASLIAVLPTALTSVALVAGSVKLASRGVAEALSAVASGADDAGEQIAALSPPARRFVLEVARVIPQVDKLRLRLAEGLFPGVTEGFKALLPLFPDVDRAMTRTAATIGNLAASLGQLVGGPLRNEFRDILRVAGDLVEIFAGNVGGLVTAFVTASAAAAPLARLIAFDLSENLAKLTDRFIQIARTDEFTDFLEDSYRNLRLIGQIMGDLGVGIGQGFLAALAPGERLLIMLRGLTFEFREFANSAEGQERMRAFFDRAAASAALFASVAGNVLAAVFNIGKAAGPAGTALMQTLDGATESFRRFTGSVEGQNRMRAFFDSMVPVVTEFGRLVVDVSKALVTFAALPGNEALLRQIRTELLPAVTRLFIVISETGVLNTFVRFLTRATELLTIFAANGKTINGVLDVFNGALTILGRLLELPGMANLLTLTTYLVGAGAALRLVSGLALGVATNVGFLIRSLDGLMTVAARVAPVLRTAIVGGLLRLAPLIAPALALVFSPPVLIAAAVAAVGVLAFTFRDEIGRFFTETLPRFFTETVPGVFTRLAELFEEHSPAVLQFFRDLPGRIAESMGFVAGYLLGKGIEMLTGFDDGVLRVWQGEDGNGGVKAWFRGLGDRIVTEVGDVKDKLLVKGHEIIAGFFRGVGLEWDERKSFWENLGINIAAMIANPDQILRTVGRKILGGLFDGARAELIFAGNLALDVDQALRTAFRTSATWLYQAGKDAILGFFRGVGEFNKAIYDTAKDVAGKFIKGFKEGLESSSPSRKMMAEGVNAIAGFMIGVDSQRSALERQVASIAATVVDGFSGIDPTFNGSVQTYSVAPRPGNGAEQQPTVIKHYNLTLQSSYESQASPEENFRRMELLEPVGV